VKARNNLALILDAPATGTAHWRSWIAPSKASPTTSAVANRAAILGATVRYAAAQRDLQRVLRAEPANVEALFNLGIVLTRRGMWREGIDQLKPPPRSSPAARSMVLPGEALNHIDDPRAPWRRTREPSSCSRRIPRRCTDRQGARPPESPRQATAMYRRSRK